MVITDWDLSLDQFLDLPEATPALEYDPPCDGQGASVRQKMSPTAGHSAIQTAFTVLLDRLEAQGFVVRTELRIVRRSAKVPEVCVYREEALAEARLLRGRFPTTPPEVAIEIRSPDDEPDDLVAKYRFYVDDWGCPLALLVDPASPVPEVVAFCSGLPPSTYRGDEPIEPLRERFGLDLTPHAVWLKARLS